MRHGSDPSRPEREHQNATILRPLDNRRGIGRLIGQLEKYEIRLDVRQVDDHAWAGREPLRYQARIRMVFGQSLQVVVESVEPGRRENANLSHRAAEHPPAANSL